MSIITLAARKAWLESSSESYPSWIAKQKLAGYFWSASDE